MRLVPSVLYSFPSPGIVCRPRQFNEDSTPVCETGRKAMKVIDFSHYLMLNRISVYKLRLQVAYTFFWN